LKSQGRDTNPAMSEVTLDMILAEMTRMNLQTHQGFKEIKIEINGIKSEITSIRDEMKVMNQRMDGMAKDIKMIRNQTARLTERIVFIEDALPQGSLGKS
jgi:uncharacterized protein (DUF3084 family)